MEKREIRTMDKVRRPFQGVINIIRFNWHFYVGVILICVVLYYLGNTLVIQLELISSILIVSILVATLVSIVVSLYIYDLSGLYNLNWLPDDERELNIVNINAGFDETSELLKMKYTRSDLVVLDFYNPLKHTEVSIKRARRAYPPYQNTIKVESANLPILTGTIDNVFVVFSAHEIRDTNERITFFRELNRILKPDGEIYVTEHLRDVPNFLAYNIGCFHFLSKRSWHSDFSDSGLSIKCEQKLNPFITNFTLVKNGITS